MTGAQKTQSHPGCAAVALAQGVFQGALPANATPSAFGGYTCQGCAPGIYEIAVNGKLVGGAYAMVYGSQPAGASGPVAGNVPAAPIPVAGNLPAAPTPHEWACTKADLGLPLTIRSHDSDYLAFGRSRSVYAKCARFRKSELTLSAACRCS